ncbi:MAG: TetR/AcrR family transcriptional regulator [Solirubrobacterales bacterium]
MLEVSSPPANAASSRGPRRMAPKDRREQLLAAAMAVVAEQGFTDFSLDDVAARADVTRNLLYHYFPGGRAALALAVADAAGHELTDDWLTDESIPLAERLIVNNGRLIEHAMAPTVAWTLYRHALQASDPELRAKTDDYVEGVIAAIALNHFGTEDPSPPARAALKGYLAFFGAALDEARANGTPPERMLPILTETLAAAMGAAGSAGPTGD